MAFLIPGPFLGVCNDDNADLSRCGTLLIVCVYVKKGHEHVDMPLGGPLVYVRLSLNKLMRIDGLVAETFIMYVCT